MKKIQKFFNKFNRNDVITPKEIKKVFKKTIKLEVNRKEELIYISTYMMLASNDKMFMIFWRSRVYGFTGSSEGILKVVNRAKELMLEF